MFFCEFNHVYLFTFDLAWSVSFTFLISDVYDCVCSLHFINMHVCTSQSCEGVPVKEHGTVSILSSVIVNYFICTKHLKQCSSAIMTYLNNHCISRFSVVCSSFVCWDQVEIHLYTWWTVYSSRFCFGCPCMHLRTKLHFVMPIHTCLRYQSLNNVFSSLFLKVQTKHTYCLYLQWCLKENQWG